MKEKDLLLCCTGDSREDLVLHLLQDPTASQRELEPEPSQRSQESLKNSRGEAKGPSIP